LEKFVKEVVRMIQKSVSRRSLLKGLGGALAISTIPVGFNTWGQTSLNAAWVYLTSPGDAGWTFRHDQGRQFAAANLSDIQLITATTENVADADAERVVRNFATQGFDITFSTSFGFMDGTLAVADEFTEQSFEHCSGFKTTANMGNYFGRMFQARYLSGIVAGLMTDSNQLGYVAAIPIPEVVRIANAFYLGARSVNPDVTMNVTGLGSFFDPPKAREQAFALIDAGADVVTMHEDTPSVPQAAQDRGVFSVSYQSDMSAFAPDSHITGVEWDWGPYYLKTLELLRDGELAGLSPREVWSGLDDTTFASSLVDIRNEVGGGDSGLINEALIANVRDQNKVNEILDALESARASLVASTTGGNEIFEGVVNANTGEVAFDGIPSDGDLLGMVFPVEGVSGPSFFPS
jgi:basic membrane protein A